MPLNTPIGGGGGTGSRSPRDWAAQGAEAKASKQSAAALVERCRVPDGLRLEGDRTDVTE
jgi:hypothetical protein